MSEVQKTSDDPTAFCSPSVKGPRLIDIQDTIGSQATVLFLWLMTRKRKLDFVTFLRPALTPSYRCYIEDGRFNLQSFPEIHDTDLTTTERNMPFSVD